LRVVALPLSDYTAACRLPRRARHLLNRHLQAARCAAPSGRRHITYSVGRAVADTSETDSGAFSVDRERNHEIIRVGDERHEVPDAAPLCG
jgi:hypothetical protein